MNKATIMGRLVRDPELRSTTNNIDYCKYTVAVNRKYIKDGGQTADFINCTSWNKGAEFITKYFSKGDMIAITGRIETGSYENKEGVRVYTTELVAEDHYFCGGKTEKNGPRTEKAEDGFYPVDESEDELPF